MVVLSPTHNSVSTNFPSVLCDIFNRTTQIDIPRAIGIQRLGSSSFRNCRQLSRLRVINNEILIVDEAALVNNVQLVEVRLESNQITTLPETLFRNQHFLQELYLSHNRIAEFPIGFFRGLFNMRILNLSYNRIASLMNEWFEDLHVLYRLYLNDNLLTELPVDVFRNLRNMVAMNLKNNSLTTVGSTSFSKHPLFETFGLTNNSINAIDEELLDITGIRDLKFTNNVCANLDIEDDTPERDVIRTQLRQCFGNFVESFCPNDRIAERICALERRFQNIKRRIDNLVKNRIQ